MTSSNFYCDVTSSVIDLCSLLTSAHSIKLRAEREETAQVFTGVHGATGRCVCANVSIIISNSSVLATVIQPLNYLLLPFVVTPTLPLICGRATWTTSKKHAELRKNVIETQRTTGAKY
eukprot:scaffold86178_cov53-Cyclotella_meneghiniana.AAC.1